MKINGVLISTVLAVVFVAGSAVAQTTVNLPQMVIEEKHTEYITDPGTGSPIQVRSSNPSVATAAAYRTSQIQIVAKAPGQTTIEFYDSASRVRYLASIFVEGANATGGGGGGYDPGKTQLPQIVMLPKHTENVTVPGGGTHQLSTVVSSNPSVATARTNTANTIQIYSVALGDTFITFTDNATRTTYQVHVYVRDTVNGNGGGGNGSGGNGGGSGGGGGGGGDIRAPRPGQMDKCLVGKWLLESSQVPRQTSGGTGAVVTITANGNTTADYDRMTNITFQGDHYIWKGISTGHISAENGVLAADRVDKSTFVFDIMDANGRSMINGGEGWWKNTLGGVFPPPSAQFKGITYSCSGQSLTLKQNFVRTSSTFVFKRQK